MFLRIGQFIMLVVGSPDVGRIYCTVAQSALCARQHLKTQVCYYNHDVSGSGRCNFLPEDGLLILYLLVGVAPVDVSGM